jgi:hypothetical protein
MSKIEITDEDFRKCIREVNIHNLKESLGAEVTRSTFWDPEGNKTKKIVFEYTEDE